jgi:hypothetical protein
VSTDFIADFALGHEFRGAQWLRDVLSSEPEGVREVVARYRDRWLVHEWLLKPPVDQATEIVGPGGFAINLSASTLHLYHLLPFRRFAAQDDERALLRRACLAIATLVGSSRALYMHELLPDGFDDGLDLDQIEAKLRSNFGPPSAKFADLAAANEFEAGCWYVDDFADLRRHESSG